jgi:hypothetical protein
MLKKTVALLIAIVLTGALGACKKREQKPVMPSGMQLPKVERKVVVSKEVRSKWKAVTLSIVNKLAKTTKDYTVSIGSELAIPNTKITVKVLNFLPEFKMNQTEFYSASNKPIQPAAQVVVMENGKEIWNNWLFALQPSTHPFEHESIGITLVNGVAK